MGRRLIMVMAGGGAGMGLILSGWLAAVHAVDASDTAREAGPHVRMASGLSEINLRALEALQAPRWGRDPFALPTKEEVLGGSLSLTAILFNASSASAVINGQVVRVGDEVAGRRVVAIGRDHVVVREGKTIRRLEVPRFTVEKGKP